jgi:hypothetical protein
MLQCWKPSTWEFPVACEEITHFVGKLGKFLWQNLPNRQFHRDHREATLQRIIIRYHLAIVALGVALTGCSTHRSEDAQDPRAKMVGMQQEQVVACMGAPAKRTLGGEGEVWAYSTGNGTTGSNPSTAANSNNFSSRLCDVDIIFTNGQVSAVKYAGPIGGSPGSSDQCTNAISPCIKQRAGRKTDAQ